MKKIVYFALMALLFVSCHKDPEIDFDIKSPKAESVYYTDSNIVFSSNLNSQNLVWTSSIDGELGTGPQFVKKLSEGEHRITLYHTQALTEKYVDITVKEKKSSKKLNYALMQNTQNSYSGSDSELNKGIFVLDGNVKDFELTVAETDYSKEENSVDSDFRKDIVINAVSQKVISPSNKPSYSRQADEENKDFMVVNTVTQMDCHDVTARLIYSSENLQVYLDESYDDSESIIDCVKEFEERAYKRVVSIWGKCSDINNDGKFTLLFTPWLNQENVAVGFFNQNDFFAHNDDVTSESYNPFSNQMDICYVAVPDEADVNYSNSSLIATMAHELTHAVNFSTKVYKKLLSGNENAPRMEIFLDEGLAHLTESLIGYGESGGNLKFVDRYVKKSYLYSFCSSDVYGQTDSIYQRGAMTMFLYYLFCKKSGIQWSGNNIVENDGIDFLNKIVTAEDCGWQAIGEAYGSNTDTLFTDFCIDIFEKDMKEIFDFETEDPFTKEKIFYCENITPVNYQNKLTLVSYSITKFDLTGAADLEVNCESLSGNAYFVY